MNLKKARKIYMVGIGGIGMSALAQLLKHAGVEVSGSDRERSPTTDLLIEKGIFVTIGHARENISAGCDLLIYSDAVWGDNPERVAARQKNITEVSYFEALGEISKHARTIAVAGTHGKTTTTGMLAKILQDGRYEPTAIVGSIVRDFGSNFISGRNDLLIVEACEYRDHVLRLSPDILVITNIELDHTDYFPTLLALEETFARAVAKVPRSGFIITDPSDAIVARVLRDASATIIDYMREKVPELGLIGEFNRANARAASAAARAAFPDIKQGTIDRALISFKGSWRRFEYKGETLSGALVYDDYAHHPTAVEKTIAATREKFLDKRIIVAFHPHLYSRTRSFLQEFGRALAKADTSIIAPIYAAREEPDQTISHHVLADTVNHYGGNALALDSFGAIRDKLLSYDDGHLIITMGAGDIYKVAEQIVEE